jgi:hypothetical protein
MKFCITYYNEDNDTYPSFKGTEEFDISKKDIQIIKAVIVNYADSGMTFEHETGNGFYELILDEYDPDFTTDLDQACKNLLMHLEDVFHKE